MKYFFDLTDETGETADSEGVELETLDQVRAEAWRAVGGIVADDHIDSEALRLSLRVRDATNVKVYELSLTIKARCLPH